MSQESVFLARLASKSTHELKATAVDVFGSADLFTSKLTSEYTRKRFYAYNNSNASSGEVVFGPATLTAASGMIIPKGEIVNIETSTAVDVYFCNTVSGEVSNLRVVEMA